MAYVSVLVPGPIRLGFGEYTLRDSWVRSLMARDCFLEALVLIEPASLRTLVTPNGIALATSAEHIDLLPQYQPEPYAHGSLMPIYGAPGAFDGFLSAWKRQWTIPDPWMDVIAADTLIEAGRRLATGEPPVDRFKTVSPSASSKYDGRPSEPAHVRDSDVVTTLPLINVEYPDGQPAPVWDPFREPRASAKLQLMAIFEHALDELMDHLEAHWKQDHYVPTIVKRHPEHFDWLVHYQTLGKSYGEIQKSLAPEISRQAIAKALKETASLMRLTLRQPNKPGAPQRSQKVTEKLSTLHSRMLC
jgi:hypothetical protein